MDGARAEWDESSCTLGENSTSCFEEVTEIPKAHVLSEAGFPPMTDET